MKSIGFWLAKCLAVVAAIGASISAIWPSFPVFYQPEEPEEIKKLRGS